MIQYGFLLALASLSAFFVHFEETSGVLIGLGLMIFAVVMLISNVEKALKKNFGNA